MVAVNEEGKQGFGHIGFLVDDVNVACSELAKAGASFRKEPNGGKMKGSFISVAAFLSRVERQRY